VSTVLKDFQSDASQNGRTVKEFTQFLRSKHVTIKEFTEIKRLLLCVTFKPMMTDDGSPIRLS
jgi:hypothetical protein